MSMHPRIRTAWPGAGLAAPACPVRCAGGDNLAVHAAVTRAHRGHALVVSVGDVPDRGYWGEVLTTGAMARGLAGLVIDGGVRDTTALEAHRFPVFAATVALRGATKALPGTVGAPVTVGGVVVAAGDWVVGDGDGVVVVPRERLADVMAAGRARAEKEAGLFASLRGDGGAGGQTTVELLGLDVSKVEISV